MASTRGKICCKFSGFDQNSYTSCCGREIVIARLIMRFLGIAGCSSLSRTDGTKPIDAIPAPTAASAHAVVDLLAKP